MSIMFELRDVKKIYDGKTVLRIDELKLEAGKINAIIGPSGAGKSTLLQLLNGLEGSSEGAISFDGEKYTKGKKIPLNERRKMAMVFQKPTLFNSSVYENIAYPLKLRRIPTKTISQKVNEVLELVGLRDKARQGALTLSGGEAQRISVARAIVTHPKALLLDEPTANLDPANVELIERIIKHANSAHGATVVIVTHNMFQAKRLGDNIVFLLNGQIVESGPSDIIFSDPKNEKTSAFIRGEMVC